MCLAESHYCKQIAMLYNKENTTELQEHVFLLLLLYFDCNALFELLRLLFIH